MENSPNQVMANKPKIVVLRWGHRIHRDSRLTTHCALTARALCASGFILADIEDNRKKKPLKVCLSIGAAAFLLQWETEPTAQ
jgi:tRNA (cytidine56-2'-O)-methyltransferase